ncbi:Zn-dependent hydrolase, partial [Gemmatimonadota bacterium]
LPASGQQMQRGAHRTPDGLPHVDRARLEHNLQTLGGIGRDPVTGGIERTAFSAADLEARRWFITRLEEAGLSVQIDEIANIIGRLPGQNPEAEAIVLGSHLDSVPQGGRFDGALGLMIALELVESMRDLNIHLSHPLEIVSFSDEEGGLLGSRGWIGTLTGEDLAEEYHGRPLTAILQDLGLDPERVPEARRSPEEIAAYLEVHIEQGRVLEREGLQVGIVEGIVALDEYEITVHGTANHAGTTRMSDREDPMAAVARMVVSIREEVEAQGGDLVATVGRIGVEPGAPNVIPSIARFTIDIRDPSRIILDRAITNLIDRFDTIAREEGVMVGWETLVQIPAAPADQIVIDTLLEAAAPYGYPHRIIPSGAGHDAQSIARLAPMGMLFAPSVGGLSHSPAEFTRTEDAAACADVLLRAIMLLDQKLR